MKYFMLAITALVSFTAEAQRFSLQQNKASHHEMEYFISLPEGWSAEKEWPVLLVLEGADKEYKLNAEKFAAARGSLPFIIVAPFIVTNGSQGQRDPYVFPYSISTWDKIDKQGVCAFDENGIENIMNDVQVQYHGSKKYFVTGFEAGAHLAWSLVFQRPEKLNAAIIVSGNYRGRCMEKNEFSNDAAAKANLPVISLYGTEDELWKKAFGLQDEIARKLAVNHNYKNVRLKALEGKGHVPAPAEVFALCKSFLQ